MTMKKNEKILVLGATGLVGNAVVKKLMEEGYKKILTPPRSFLNLENQRNTYSYFMHHKPNYVFLCAAKVGGILENSLYPADFISSNISISKNVIDASHITKVKKLLNLGSSCIYPKECEQPMKEEYLLTGKLEETNEAYAIAKIMAIELCKFYNKQYGTNFISLMPSNLYGENDNFDLRSSHVLPALLRKMHEATVDNKKTVEVWGTGLPKREFIYVGDLAKICVEVMNIKHTIPELINIGAEEEISIKDLALLIKEIVGFEGHLVFDLMKPDGVSQKRLDTTFMKLHGLACKTNLRDGITKTYEWYKKNYK